MAYTTSSPPALLAQGIGGVGKIWQYRSTDASSAVDADGYITNASVLGMTVGDGVIIVDTDASPPTVGMAYVNSVTAGGAGDLTDATNPSDSD
jgi:hypothetical protein